MNQNPNSRSLMKALIQLTPSCLLGCPRQLVEETATLVIRVMTLYKIVD